MDKKVTNAGSLKPGNYVIFDDHISKRIWIDIDTYTVINLFILA